MKKIHSFCEMGLKNWEGYVMTQQKQVMTWDEFIKPRLHSAATVDPMELIPRLEHPKGKVDMVMDTDTYNEIDDQYAVAYALACQEKLSVKAIYAAPFFNQKSTGPADGMEKSYQEILRILKLTHREDLNSQVYRGSTRYLPDEKTPVYSEAAQDLAERAMHYTSESPLYVVAIGAITNVASALLINPEIRNRIVVVWLGGHSLEWPDNLEFNLLQDIAAARVIFGCGVPLIQLPCMGVVSAFTISGPELEYHLRGKNALCNYLVDVTCKEALDSGAGPTWTRAIWDVTAVAWLADDHFMESRLEHAPIPEYDDRYSFDKTRHFYRYVYHIHRDQLFADLFQKLSAF